MENIATIERCVNLVIRSLQVIGFFEEIPRVTGWHLRWDKQRLSRLDFRAAATAEGEYPVMILSEDFCLERDLDALIHESIHLAQIIKCDFEPGYGDGISTWKGRKYHNLPANHERYFEDQPWEDEAQELFPSIVKKMSELSERHPQTFKSPGP